MTKTTSLPLLAAVGLLAVAPPALAAPAKLAGGSVSDSGTAAVKITNPNRYALEGTVTLSAGRSPLGSRKVRIKSRRSAKYSLKLSATGLEALKTKGSLTTTMTAKLARRGHKATSYRKVILLKAGGGGVGGPGSGAPGAGTPGAGTPGAGSPGSGSPGSPGGGPVSNRWTATKSGGGTFGLTLDGGTLALTQPTLMFVSCGETGGSYRVASSSEMFDLTGGWALGDQSTTQKQLVPRVNQLVGSSARTVTYTLKSSRSGDQITGSLVQSFSDSRYDPFTNRITFVNCAGTVGFTAAPAP